MLIKFHLTLKINNYRTTTICELHRDDKSLVKET
jgi:hypothetical protein